MKTNKTSTKRKMTKKTAIKTLGSEFEITKIMRTIMYLQGQREK
jgi:hypothetical protein